MTSWIFDNVGDTTLEALAEQIKAAGGIIDGELRKLDKGGVAAQLDSATATATMSKMADWCAERKIRSHLPKTVLRGTTKIIIKNLPIDYEASDIVEALLDEGVEAVELYMFKNSRGTPTGTVKAVVKASNMVKKWLDNRRGEIRGVRVPVERQRAAVICFQCNRIGHRAGDCTEAKKCKKCGQEGHLKAECQVGAEALADKCNYCFEGGHRRGGCDKKREDEREERHKHKMERKDPTFENVWEKRKQASNEANENEHSDEMENDGMKGWGDMKEEIRKEMKDKMKEFQTDVMNQVMNQVKTMMNEMMNEMMKAIKTQMAATINEAMQGVMKQQQEWQQQRKDPLTTLKRGMEHTPKEQKGSRKKNDKEEGEGKNLAEDMDGAGMEEEDEEEEKEKTEGRKPRRGAGQRSTK